MRRATTRRTILRSALPCAVTLLLSLEAHAQLFRAYLDPTGSDANPCTLAQPCRLLPAALAAVADGGEIWMLDSANYNTAPVQVTKSVTILAVPGVVGSVVATGGTDHGFFSVDGEAFRIATPGVKVALRNLVIVPLPGGIASDGILMTAGDELTVENCLIANMPADVSGIQVNGPTSVRITDTTIRNNGGWGIGIGNGTRATITRVTVSGHGNAGIHVGGSLAGTTTTADIADSTLDRNISGVWASTGGSAVAKVSVRDSRIVANTFGLLAQTSETSVATISASNNIVSNNTTAGIEAFSAGSKVWASGNTVSGNGKGIFNSGGIIESAGNNAVRNNTTADTDGTITVVTTQ